MPGGSGPGAVLFARYFLPEEKARELLGHQVRVLYQIAASDGQPLAAIETVPADCDSDHTVGIQRCDPSGL